jgi:DNA mismatch repair protein MutS2
MPFSTGDAVLVVTLKRRGEIVERRGRSYRVLVGGMAITCRAEDLRPADPETGSGRKRTPRRMDAAQQPSPAAGSGHREDGRSTIDLHGLTTVEAREALLLHIDAALRAGHAIVEVVHGIGTGRVRAAVLEMLKHIPSVRQVRPHPTNRGVTIVHL